MQLNKVLILAILIILIPATGLAQYGPGQYETEAPLRTWNTWGPATAAYTGYGGSCFARAFDCSVVPTNPALLNKLPKFNLVMSGSLYYNQLNKYGPVNTGVLTSSGNLGLKIYAYDFIGVSYLYGKWGLSISQTHSEDYFRPDAEYTEFSEGNAAYDISFYQNGGLNRLNLSISRRFNSWLSLGLGLNMIKGSRERKLLENYYYSGVIITDQKQHDISGYFVNAGLVLDLAKKLTAGLIFRSPYTRKSESESEYRFQALSSGTDISIPAQDECSFRMPLVLGAGVNYSISAPVSLALDVSFFNWENYNDLGTAYGWEKGSGDNLKTYRLTLSLGYRL